MLGWWEWRGGGQPFIIFPPKSVEEMNMDALGQGAGVGNSGADEVPEGSAAADSTGTFAAGPSARVLGVHHGRNACRKCRRTRETRRETHERGRHEEAATLTALHLLTHAKS